MIKAPISLQDLRRRLYVKAKTEPSWRFWGLYVHVCKRETLHEAYLAAKANDGAPGIDGVTFAAVEAGGVEEFLDQLRKELVERTYRPQGHGRWRSRRVAESAPAFDSICSGPGGPGSVEADPGTDLRGRFSTGVVWLPAEEVSAQCDPARQRGDSPGQDLRH